VSDFVRHKVIVERLIPNQSVKDMPQMRSTTEWFEPGPETTWEAEVYPQGGGFLKVSEQDPTGTQLRTHCFPLLYVSSFSQAPA
jgi:hypothetical protein